jgi:DNA helicase-2/ATP-dependent DNA helicase PcrA
VLFAAHDEGEESRFVVEQIIRYADAGGRMRDAAILYRSNAQSRAFEEALMQKGLPYRVYGGVRFFERMEIKDALAYMRLLANPHDDQAFERAIATPSRGIGEKSVEQLRQLGRQLNCSSWDLLSLHQTQLPTRARTSLLEFGTLIEGMRAELKNSPLKHQIEVMLERSGLRVHYEKDQKQSRAGVDSRVENLDELINVAARFEDDRIERDESMSELTAFLSYAALEAGENQSQAFEDAVQLMTLHAAKGLEFPLVCLSGLEEGLFPLQRAIDERGGALEEERRLAYVGVTRACKQLVISYAESRRRFGEFAYARPSRFISEIPKHLISELRPRGGYARAFQASEYERPASHLKLGAQVEHPRFGEGVVLGVQGSGEHTRVVVNFESVGTKELVLAFCNLKAL